MRKAFILLILLPFLLVTLAVASAVAAVDTPVVFQGSDGVSYVNPPVFDDIFSATCNTEKMSLTVFITGWDSQNVTFDDFLFYGGLGGAGDILGLPDLYG